ncbi:similar to Saccharomyces cerevisiae YDR520C URC2 Putative Zn(II)2Cys6 motif containing transcription factor [Maudiozyma barnettii]|uniref:Similar to Saccharomyces cerevisiae YDR520C URC2 Putative Zn(II)2Cys6 motif containing transcription factor n=1 Tax=Maudiozyma barnettii TaxID=61262 RepID=A0A8H2VGV5_9SACH|nr:Urc2p [Kazachstania barnettii]CAB4255225.1 similar to Saccharomyces cerevisiae YDR520C URC2 Putative Zn(II)2Cys6 motif containing transcription factor [Kazachstania barnettii]CAD1783633.1 similar to Saccharomyces cerevisiae YDR520C URC2 Putative Zn(II)2Cys6 motif containing transcription factor [Kazachstania barnettii]
MNDNSVTDHSNDDEVLEPSNTMTPVEKTVNDDNNDIVIREDRKNIDPTKKMRKKRKLYSCETCRKFKTRCDFEPIVGKCHRCNVLKISCSLTREREEEIFSAIETNTFDTEENVNTERSDTIFDMDTSKGSMIANHPLTTRLNERLTNLENKFDSLTHKIDLLLLLAQGSSSAKSSAEDVINSSNAVHDNLRNKLDTPHNISLKKITSDEGHIDELNTQSDITSTEFYKLKETPLKIINDIDERLFPLTATSKKEALDREQRPSAVARVNFLQFYGKNSALCLGLCKEFLVRSHFWIIPGGIKELNDDFVKNHLFITSVYTIIAMSSSDNEKYDELQETLYPLVERLLTNTLTMFDKLIVHDIEAILYCCMFHISRKAKRHRQLKFNSMVLANFALFSLMNNVDFYKLKERVLTHEKYEDSDLYHLRVLNSLTACHLQYSIAHGSMVPQDKMLKEFNNLIAKFPQSNFGDDIKLSEINLGDIVTSIFTDFGQFFEDFLTRFSNDHQNTKERQFVIFPELNYWLKNWEELLAKDGGGVLLFTYDFYHTMICRSFLIEFLDQVKTCPFLLESLIYTMREHIFSLLKGFLRLPPSLIKGAPILTTNEMVYACMTLSDYLHWFEPNEKQEILSICTRVYWHLNTIGEKLNEVTENVGKIIKFIITTAKNRANMGPFTPSFVDISTLKPEAPEETQDQRSISTVIGRIDQNFTSEKDTSTQQKDKSVKVQLLTKDNKSLLNTNNDTATVTNKAGPQFSMPDADRFNSFEDFFQDFFTHLKPATQKMFPSSK